MRNVALLAGLIVALSAGHSVGSTGTASPGASSIWEALSLVKVEPPLRSLRAYRRLEKVNQRFKKHGWMDVIAAGGSPLIRNRVLRPVLEGERQLLAASDPTRTALSSDNYAVVGEAPGGDVLQLTVKALRREITLVNGTVDVTGEEIR